MNKTINKIFQVKIKMSVKQLVIVVCKIRRQHFICMHNTYPVLEVSSVEMKNMTPFSQKVRMMFSTKLNDLRKIWIYYWTKASSNALRVKLGLLPYQKKIEVLAVKQNT